MSTSIKVDQVSMMFNMSSEKVDNIKEYFIRVLKHKIAVEPFWALQDVSFELKRGDSLGVIGLNGSGKSTLLKLVSGILKPTKGTVETYGSIAPLIELARASIRNFPPWKTSTSTARCWAIRTPIWKSGWTAFWILPSWRNSATSPSKTFLPA